MRVVDDTIVILNHFLQLQRPPTVTFFWFHMFHHLLLIVILQMTRQVFATTDMDQDVKEVVELIGGLLNSAKGTGS